MGKSAVLGLGHVFFGRNPDVSAGSRRPVFNPKHTIPGQSHPHHIPVCRFALRNDHRQLRRLFDHYFQHPALEFFIPALQCPLSFRRFNPRPAVRTGVAQAFAAKVSGLKDPGQAVQKASVL